MIRVNVQTPFPVVEKDTQWVGTVVPNSTTLSVPKVKKERLRSTRNYIRSSTGRKKELTVGTTGCCRSFGIWLHRRCRKVSEKVRVFNTQ